MINKEELRLVLKEIETNPEQWDQEFWAQQALDPQGNVCETAYCFAGHTIQRAGYQIHFSSRPTVSTQYASWCRDENGVVHHISVAAQKVLGLTDYQAERLFRFDNSLGALRGIVDELCADEDDAGDE